MKHTLKNRIHVFSFLFLMAILSSCEQVLFDGPQPHDESDIMEFPKELTGYWTFNDSSDFLIIGKNYLSLQNKFTMKLAETDVEANENWIVKKDKMYWVDNESEFELSRGYDYTIENDSFVIKRLYDYFIALGKKAMLRKLDNGYILSEQKGDNWWELYYIQIDKKKNVQLRRLNKEDFSLLPDVEMITENNSTVYVSGNVSRKQWQIAIRAGAFSDTLQLQIDLKDKKELPN